MKNITAMIAVLITLFTFCSCTQKTYDDGYQEGYSDGYFDAESDADYLFEKDFSDGYDIGYNDGYMEVHTVIDDAEDYARSKTGWSVYEAWNNIRIYNDGIDPYGYPLPTKEEYLQSIDTLVLFCEYLENAGLGG